jgi:hypothetical protein
MSFIVSQGILGLPDFFLVDKAFQNFLKLSFLQESRVSGVTKIRDSFQFFKKSENDKS